MVNQAEVFNVSPFAGVPILLLLAGRRVDDGIRAGAHNIRNSIAEAVTNVVREPWLPALILDGVMQQGSNRHVLGAIVLEHCRCDRKQMCDVGNTGRFADLPTINVSGVQQGSIKTISYSGFRSYGSIACMFVIMGAFPRLEDVQERADGAVEAGDGACGQLAQVRLEFAVRQFDRVEIG